MSDRDPASTPLPRKRSPREAETRVNWRDLKERNLSPARLKRVAKDARYLAEQIDLALLLRSGREAAGKTQVQLAPEMAMTQSELSRFERRLDPRLSTLRRWADAVGHNLNLVLEIHGKPSITVRLTAQGPTGKRATRERTKRDRGGTGTRSATRGVATDPR